LLQHWTRCALSLAAASAGNRIAAKMAIMAITTSNSIKVKPRRCRIGFSATSFIGFIMPLLFLCRADALTSARLTIISTLLQRFFDRIYGAIRRKNTFVLVASRLMVTLVTEAEPA